jgi:hypothetical protein
MSEAKCSCQFCNGHISFPAEMAGQMSDCPHCGLETKLFIPNVTKAPANSPPKNVSVEIKRGANPLGIASLVLGISACVFCWIPFLGLLAIPLAAIGLLLAVIGITSAMVGKKSSPAFPSGGAVVCIVAILVALFVTGGISTLIAKHQNQSNATNQKIPTESTPASMETTGNLAAATAPQLTSPSSAEIWSRSRVVQQGNMQIEIEEWHGNYGNIIVIDEQTGEQAEYNEYYSIKLNLFDLSKTKKIDFTSWRGKPFSATRDYAILTDDNGNVYKKIDFGTKNVGLGDSKIEQSIYPQQSSRDFVVFEQPVSNRKWLHLELPAENFGGSGMIRFEIPNPNFTSQSAGKDVQEKAEITPKSFKLGDVDVIINDVVHGFQTGESPTERGLIVKTSNLLLVTIDLNNSSSDKICDYTTFRQNAVLTDNKGNNYKKLERFAGHNLNTRNEEYGRVTDGWVSPNYTLFADVKFYADSSRIQPKTGREDMLGFEIPNSPGGVLYLELPAANLGGTGKIKFEIPVGRIKNW